MITDDEPYLEILKYPDPRLNQVSVPVTEFNEWLYASEKMMFATMIANHGIGLAAPQVNDFRRFFIVKLHFDKPDSPEYIFINPEIIWTSEKTIELEEGCLSFPQYTTKVVRPESVTIKYQNNNGKFKELQAKGLLARVIQHEIDHLNGKLLKES
jgi:peptide deformylase